MDSLSMRDKALLKRSVSKHHNTNFKAGYVPVHEQYLHKTGLRGRKTFAFWTLVCLLFILAVGNLILTITILGVLKLGHGMESLELIPEESAIKFFGDTDLDYLYKRDGKIEGFRDTPVQIDNENSSFCVRINANKNDRPNNKLKVNKNGTYFVNMTNFEVKDKQGNLVFSAAVANFNIKNNLKKLATKIAQTNRLVSPVDTQLEIDAKNVYLRGAEGTLFESREIVWSADQDIYLFTNGSLEFNGKKGIFIDVKRIPIAVTKHGDYISAQYKVCVCMPQGKLFRIPVSNSERIYCSHANLINNPCM